MDRLIYAVRMGDLGAVKECLEGGANPNVQNAQRWTPLHCAAFDGHTKIASILLGRGADVNAKNDSDYQNLR